MGVDSRKPPLPAPTESMDETSGVETELATNVTTRTDKTSYSIPDDGSPITISTHKVHGSKEGGLGGHHRQKSQTSLLIEYFETGKSGDRTRSKPSVRVKVTPSSAKRSKSASHDAIQITGIGKDRKTSYTRRISLGSSKNVELGHPEGTEISQSSESNVSGRQPLEIELLNGSDMSNGKSSRGLLYAPQDSNVSSMPPDSLIDGSGVAESERSRGLDRGGDVTGADSRHLAAPIRSRSRSTSKDRITQKVMEKLGQSSSRPHKSSRSGHERSISQEYEPGEKPTTERHRRTSRTHHGEEDTVSGVESSLLSSQPTGSQVSYRSDRSQASRMTNNPKLLEMVEDTIKRMILPEINAIKEDRKTDRNLQSFDNRRRDSLPRDGYEESDLSRRLSKSSSSPNVAGRPKVVLNREGDDPGTVLSRGDSERKKMRKSSRESYTEHRPSSRRSSDKHSRHGDGYDEDERIRHKSSRGSHGLRDAATAGIAGGVLSAAALEHHDAQSDGREHRKKHTKSRSSRSRSTSITEGTEKAYTRKEDIPPMPLASHINDSELTRDSIVSTSTERADARESSDVRTPICEISRGSVGDSMSPASRTPTRTPVSRGLGMSHTNQSIGSPKSGRISDRARMAGLAAAGLGGVALAKTMDSHDDRHFETEDYADHPQPRSIGSPVQSVSSLKKQFEDEEALVPQGLRPKSAASRSSAGQTHGKRRSQTSLNSHGSTPVTKLARSRMQSQNMSGDEFTTPLERPDDTFLRDRSATPGTPNGESVDDWYEREHQLNNRYRDSAGETTTNRDSYQTNPYPEDDKRFTMLSEDSIGNYVPRELGAEQGIRPIAAVPEYVNTPVGVESAVASLMEPSTVSSNVVDSPALDSPAKPNGTYAARMAAHLRDMDKEGPAVYNGSTLSQTIPSQDRWAAMAGHARSISASTSKDDVGSPRQSEAKSLRQERSTDQRPVMSASGLPVADDPLPEIGHFDDSKSDLTTNPSIIHGPLGGDETGKDTWPYTPEPQQRELGTRDSRSMKSDRSHNDGLLLAAAGGAAALAAAHSAKQPTVEDEDFDQHRRLTPDVDRDGRDYEIDREATPTSPAAFRDEGYVTDAHARSVGAITPGDEPNRYSRKEMKDYEQAMDAQSLGEEDTFVGNAAHARHVSGDSHGMASPLYDSATGKGVDSIQSKDIVALMDHLTVRDAQRNARDTEILVTLVRSAAEMRQNFDEMKRFIAEQDRLIMQNTDRTTEHSVQKALSGPRPQPLGSPRTPKRESQEDVQAKRKNVLRRALKGLTGGRRADDLARVEDMLMNILDNVEDLKHNGVAQQPTRSYTNDSLDSYEKLRAAPDSGYEPEGQAGTSSTASHSGQFSITPRVEKQQFHSGYDGRRGSEHRVSTVLEGDEDELEPHENHVLNHQFENNERMLTPTQEVQRQRGLSPSHTPPYQAATYHDPHLNDLTPRTADKQRKHKSNSSSVTGMPKVSRWSKTTASSAAPDSALLDSPNMARGVRPSSETSRSGSELDHYDDEPYDVRADDRLRSTQSLAREQGRPHSQAEARSVRSQASRITRTPSPLIPSELSSKHQDQYEDERGMSPVQHDSDLEFDDPKYQAHRNSLLLQHPQPRQGTTPRHQNTLESRAQTYDDISGTNSDLSQKTISDTDPLMFGSSGTAALAKNRFSQADPLSPVSLTSPTGYGTARTSRDEGPLVPQSKPQAPAPKVYDAEPEEDWEPQYSNSGFSKGGYYSSPYGSGHLLEPIEEVRYSLETDTGHVRLQISIPKYTLIS